MKRLWFASAFAGLIGSSSSPAVEMRTPFSFEQPERGNAVTWIMPNAAFFPAPGSSAALEPFRGGLLIDETPMEMRPPLGEGQGSGKKSHQFPSVWLGFITMDGELIPVTSDVVRAGSLPDTSSSWDIVVRPGRVWSDPMDEGWNRASFSFALVDPSSGATHDGVAMFLYRGTEIRDLRYQIVPEKTAASGECFTAAGLLPARFEAGDIDEATVRARHLAARKAPPSLGGSATARP
ncbi:hypothetical protein [Tianweitania sediminis]|uniref:Uncharacterized protein n=1 Tax=Tianweitania sediminis TaxID=1502156 RepID=A0A8J7QXY2_9HYPH|nr:hypothetical protein [Tianweitania sediminis]MBP0437930.1 hypothetical protein [Tianweitania sediminis]